jgi:hypothetical protein
LLGKSLLPNVRRSGLTKNETFSLWRAAIKDDAGFIDVIIDKTYGEMMVFDGERAKTVIEPNSETKLGSEASVPRPAAGDSDRAPRSSAASGCAARARG